MKKGDTVMLDGGSKKYIVTEIDESRVWIQMGAYLVPINRKKLTEVE